MDNIWSFMDIIFVGAGAYLLYSWFLMKTKGEIKTAFLMNKDVDLRKCKDLEGYKSFIAPKILIFGIVTLLYGVSGLINSYALELSTTVYMICMAVFAVALVWFALQTRKGLRLFW
jgi:hypothetical protein